MNRLIIIGNGFDLAHGLPTSYRDFIDDYWKSGNVKKRNDNLCTLNIDDNVNVSNVKCLKDIITLLEDKSIYPELHKHRELTYIKHLGNFKSEYVLNFKNGFFKQINQNLGIQNWVDIENEYYKLLKDYLNKGKSIIDLNREFDEVKSLLEKYLIKNVEEKFEFSSEITSDIVNIFKPISYKNTELEEFFKEISKKGEIMLKEDFHLLNEKRTGFRTPDYKNQEVKVSSFFLSFNYTSTMKSYLESLNIESEYLNEIHGSIIDVSNPINFGFGDEMDSHYKQIEDKNDNEFLKNIKSFQYLHTSNYKRLLDLIDSEVFQVYIMGHSCGLSDRTLLNTIFEHENCCSIKIYYHQKEDGSDNYTEITQNISRHFNKKKLMREKIVNKTLCQPLPQIQLPKKV